MIAKGDLRIENPKVSSRCGFIELPIIVIEEEQIWQK